MRLLLLLLLLLLSLLFASVLLSSRQPRDRQSYAIPHSRCSRRKTGDGEHHKLSSMNTDVDKVFSR